LSTYSVEKEEDFKDFFKNTKSSEFDLFDNKFEDCWIIEEKLDIIQRDTKNFFWELNPTLENVNECYSSEVFGKEITECYHVLIENQHFHSFVNRVENEKVLSSLQEQTQNLMKEVVKFNPGFACFDYLYDNTQKKLILTDINVGRLSGCFNIFLFFEIYCDHSKIISALLENPGVDFFLLYEELVKRRTFFDFNKKEGIMTCIPGRSDIWTGLIFISKDQQGLRNLRKDYDETVLFLKKNNKEEK